jgi:hypothetical protein
MATKVKARTYQGQDTEILVTLTSGQNISGWNFQWSLMVSKTDPSNVLEKDSAGGGVQIVQASPPAQVAIFLTAADTKSLKVGTYVWSLWRTDLGSATELDDGTLTVNAPTRVLP